MMETTITLLIPALTGFLALRLLAKPIGWALKFLIHGASGFLCLWLLNTVSHITGVYIPLNGVTVAAAGFLGIPGIGLLTLLELYG